MTWNHRVVKIKDSDGADWLSIREAFYNSKGELTAYTSEPVDVSGETLGELRQTLRWMGLALSKPIIDDATVKFAQEDQLNEE